MPVKADPEQGIDYDDSKGCRMSCGLANFGPVQFRLGSERLGREGIFESILLNSCPTLTKQRDPTRPFDFGSLKSAIILKYPNGLVKSFVKKAIPPGGNEVAN